MTLLRADSAQVSWDQEKSKWLIRIQVGAEVIRRHCDQPRDTSPDKVREAAVQTARDEGYELDASSVTIQQ